jgi:hypothetical protein
MITACSALLIFSMLSQTNQAHEGSCLFAIENATTSTITVADTGFTQVGVCALVRDKAPQAQQSLFLVTAFHVVRNARAKDIILKFPSGTGNPGEKAFVPVSLNHLAESYLFDPELDLAVFALGKVP